MSDFPIDIYTEPDPDVDTLKNLGPLTAMAGVWKRTGEDRHPTVNGPEDTNGPQLLYGLRYHTRIVKPEQVEMFHEQVGFWLWEPATCTVIQTIAIPRAQIAMMVGRATADAKAFRLEAVRGSETNGIVSNPFLEYAFKTLQCTIEVTLHPDG